LSIAELAVRLDDAAHILTRGSRTAHPRQQTLRATLDWSYQLLSHTERVVFERLAVFAGSFSLGAAEVVCSGADIAEAAIFESLAHLVEKSLVSIHIQDALDETRYRLLEPLRQYAQSRLTESSTELAVRQRHRDWYAAMATQAGMGGPDQARSLDRLTIEYENIRAALSWSIAHGDTTVAGNIVAEVWPFWQLRGHLHEGRRWLEHLLEAIPESTPLRAQLLWIAGILARPDVALARTRFTESLAIWQALGDQQGIARVSSTLGFVAQAQGDHAQALAYLERSLPIVRESADTAALARVLTNLALSVLASGDPQRAMSLCLEGLELNQRIGNLHGAAASIANLGMIWQARGDETRAAALWDESLALRRRIGDVGGTADVLVLLGNLAVRQHAYARANDLYLESLALRRQMAVSEGIAPVLEGLAVVGAASDDPEHAVQLAGAADALRTTLGTPLRSNDRNAHDRLLTRLRTRLGPETFRQAWDAGYRLSLDQALAVATGNRVLPGGPGLDSPSSETPAPPTTPARCPAYSLTRREIEVLRLLTHGLTYAQIGEELVISPRTVDAHIRSIFSKLDVRSRTAATRLALQHQLV
jgi:DNA-binding CsgD family transcriptional regulator/tetratricopeptide (TPR) repeat protein